MILLPQRKKLVRAMTLDSALTFDAAKAPGMPISAYGDMRGRTFDQAYRTHDGRTVDSTGAFLVGELERLDPQLNLPLAAVTWSRDIDLREDVTIGDELTSFTLTTLASPGGLGAGNGIRNGKAWIGKVTDQVAGLNVDIGKQSFPLQLWGLEIKYSIPELESAARAGRPIDDQKQEGLRLKYQMDVDEQVYVGDAQMNVGGLINNAAVTNFSNLPNGALGSPTWANKTPGEILKDVNDLITSTWAASAWAEMPNRILIPPRQYGYISTQLISSAGSVSILKYLLDNNVIKQSGKGELAILPAKWCIGAGVGGTLGTDGTVDRMVAYRKEKRLVRFPMTSLQRTPIQYMSIYHMMTYFGRLGVVEVVYPECIGYRDGL